MTKVVSLRKKSREKSSRLRFPDPAFWSQKRVLVTGHTGFKGSWLVVALKNLGADVLGYALAPPDGPSLFTALDLKQHCTHVIGDVTDWEKFNSVARDYQPDVVIHMAAQALVSRSYEDPRETFLTNTIGSSNVLEICRHLPSVKVLLNVTTDKVYENLETRRAFREEDRLGGQDPYSASKACSELITQSYYRSFFQKRDTAIITARCGNVFGGGDWNRDRIVADAVRAFSAKQKLEIRNPGAVRPWLHVLDSLRGYLLCVEDGWIRPQEFSRPWNFAPTGNPVTVKKFADMLAASWGPNASLTLAKTTTIKREANFLRLNAEDAKKSLGWIPALSLEQGVKATIAWYQKFYSGRLDSGALYEFTRAQLIAHWRIAHGDCRKAV